MIILYTDNNKLALDYAELYSVNNVLINWYEDMGAVIQYRMAHNPEPSAFPSVTDGKKIWRVTDIKQSPDWIRDEWDGKHLSEQEQLDRLVVLNKVQLLDVLDELPEERAKFDMLLQDKKFNERWLASGENLDLSNPHTQAALEQVSFDVELIKKKYLNIEV